MIHKSVPVQVWADVDEGIAESVAHLNTIPGVRTFASCQGTIGEQGASPYEPQILVWAEGEALEEVKKSYRIGEGGEGSFYVHPMPNNPTEPKGIDSLALKEIVEGLHSVISKLPSATDRQHGGTMLNLLELMLKPKTVAKVGTPEGIGGETDPMLPTDAYAAALLAKVSILVKRAWLDASSESQGDLDEAQGMVKSLIHLCAKNPTPEPLGEPAHNFTHVAVCRICDCQWGVKGSVSVCPGRLRPHTKQHIEVTPWDEFFVLAKSEEGESAPDAFKRGWHQGKWRGDYNTSPPPYVAPKKPSTEEEVGE